MSGGPCQGIRNSIPALKKIGVENEVVCMNDPSSEFIKKDDFKIHALGKGGKFWNYSGNLERWLDENLFRFDAVIIHGLWLHHGYAVYKATRKARRAALAMNTPALFVMPHGMLDPYFQRTANRLLKAIRNVIYWKFIEERVVNSADGLLFTCATELLLARESFRPYRPRKELNIGYGVAEPPEYNDKMKDAFFSKCPEVRGQNYLLFLGRIHEKKGIDILIRAYHNVYFRGNGIKELTTAKIPKLIVAGPGSETNYGRELRNYISLHKLENYIYFPGMLNDDFKWGAYYGSEAFVLPSHQENFGIAVVEAMACGKAVLISNKVNIFREIAEHGAGLVAEDTFSGTTELLLNWDGLDAAVRQQMSNSAQTCYKQHFAIMQAAVDLKMALIKSPIAV